jgi:hypothetical protein
MKKVDLLQTTILIVAILAGYDAVQNLISLLSYMAYGNDLYRLQSISPIIYNLLMVVLHAIACVILLRNARKYATAILSDEEETSWEAAAEWQLDRRNIIFVLFIGMGLYTLIQAIPYAIDHFLEFFTSKVSRDPMQPQSARKNLLLVELLRTTIGGFLIYAAPSLTNYIDKKIAVRLDSGSQSS